MREPTPDFAIRMVVANCKSAPPLRGMVLKPPDLEDVHPFSVPEGAVVLPIFSSYNGGTTVSRKLLGSGSSIETIFFGGIYPFSGLSGEGSGARYCLVFADLAIQGRRRPLQWGRRFLGKTRNKK